MLNIREASELTGFSETQLYKLCRAGEIPGVTRVGSVWIIPRDWAEAHRAGDDLSKTHIPLTEAARIAGISRQGMLDRIAAGTIKGASRPILSRRRWWVERESLARWIAGRRSKGK